MSDDRLKIAVFIDFDNIEIGVKKTLSRHFDVGAVLEAVKERGEVVTKVAYGDWKRASDYSRAMTQHAVQMVQRNLTPGGDKNGADINLALDALEMAFTRGHINAFVIVGGDSDFIALVEKLKQYDKTVFVVGGRSFTSTILQKNCHEFISYENLIGLQPTARKSSGKQPASSPLLLKDALPPIRRALEVLSDREVSPQLGLLKSTLLQLDSTFSERDYGARSFREFVQKMANAGFVRLKQVDRSLLVELTDSEPAAPAMHEEAPETQPVRPPSQTTERQKPQIRAPIQSQRSAPITPEQTAEAIALVRKIFSDVDRKPHWPMYLRNLKHFLRTSEQSFDERQYGFASFHDLVRQAHREGLLRVERNRQGIMRIYPGDQFPQPDSDGKRGEALSEEAQIEVGEEIITPPTKEEAPVEMTAEVAAESPGDGGAVGQFEAPPEGPAAAAEEPAPPSVEKEKPKRRRRTAAGKSAGTKRKKTTTTTRRKTAKKKAPEAEEN